MAANTLQRRQFPLLASVFQVLLAALFALFARVDGEKSGSGGGADISLFQDVHVMVVTGLALLLIYTPSAHQMASTTTTGAVNWSLSAFSLYFLLAAFASQWVLLLQGFLSPQFTRTGVFQISARELIRADLSALPTLISLGVLMGRLTPVQFLLLSFTETSLTVLLHHSLLLLMNAENATARTLSLHCFATYFSMATAKQCRHQRDVLMGGVERDDTQGAPGAATDRRYGPGCSGTTALELLPMLGTLLAWAYFPSLNAAECPTASRSRCVVNTQLAIGSSTIAAFMASSLIDNLGRFNLLHVQTSSLAGAVGINAMVDSAEEAWVPVALGAVMGVVSVLCHQWLTPKWLEKRLRLYDVGVVNSVHGVPSLISVLAAGIHQHWTRSGGGGDGGEMVRWALAVGLTLFTAVVGGTLTGCLLNWPLVNQLQDQPPSYEDRDYYLNVEMLLGRRLEEGLAWIDDEQHFMENFAPINQSTTSRNGGFDEGETILAAQLPLMLTTHARGKALMPKRSTANLIRAIY